MRVLGQFMRSVLNINTIWGLMILTAFFLCVVQHYLPTTTTIPAGVLEEGQNTIVIRTRDRQKHVHTSLYELTVAAGQPVIAVDDQQANKTQPWLVSARRVGAGFLLKWDYAGHGEYVAATDHAIADLFRQELLELLRF